MSGIVGMVHLDGRPVERPLLEALTRSLTFRGPDAQQVWLDGPVGFGHALLTTAPATQQLQQPHSLDGRTWITAHARIDGRDQLKRQLVSWGQPVTEPITDEALILLAYAVWGTDCPQHLVGDFAFAIWDADERRLFCARDHFGIRPFYFAQVGQTLIFSNTLDCVRLHPAVGDTLNDLAIADFLLFGFNQDAHATTFADIQRLAPAHSLTVTATRTVCEPYWTLPIEDPLDDRDADACVEAFVERFDTAVTDRIRSSQVGIFLSGGMDSTSVAAVAHAHRVDGKSIRVTAHTAVYETLFDDPEIPFVQLAADYLDMPLHVIRADAVRLYEGIDRSALRRPEPLDEPLLAIADGLYAQIANLGTRVALTGLGGDPVFYASRAYLYTLLGRGHWLRLARQFGGYMTDTRTLPPVYLRTNLRRWLQPTPEVPVFPTWLNEGFSQRLALRERWNDFFAPQGLLHPWRNEAYQALISPFWQALFERYDAGMTGYGLEVGHPFFDTRLVGYALRLPSVPWCVQKRMLRLAMQSRLPEAIYRRPKTPLGIDPVRTRMRLEPENPSLTASLAAPAAEYVDLETYQDVLTGYRANGAYASYRNMAPIGLAYWMQCHRSTRQLAVME